VPITETDWITNGFLLALAISIPISSWVGNRFGLKKTFIIAVLVYGISSLLCAFSPTLLFMSMMRFLQGLSGGIIIPVGMTMVYSVFDHSEYASITSFIFIPSLIAPTIGPALGGIIIFLFSWHWIFIFVAPICLITAICSILILREQKIENIARLDWLGFLLASGALILLLYFLTALSRDGFNIQNCIIILMSMLLTYILFKHEQNTLHPLIDFKYFQNKLFLQANIIQLTFQMCHFGAIFLIGIYLQVGIGMSALASGIVMGMQAFGSMFVSRYSVKLFHQYGPSISIITGFIGIAILSPAILLIHHTNMIVVGAILLFFRGIFSGLCGAPIQATSIIGFSKNELSDVNMIFNAGRQIAISLGVSLSSLLISYGFRVNHIIHSASVTGIGYSGFLYAFMVIPMILLIGILIAAKIDNQKVLKILAMNQEAS
jgi:EmrB/QacA subfamily drug resistance transporter